MERNNRSGQIIAIVALVASAVGISLGFAAFSNTLTIQSSAEIKPANFDVDFSIDSSTQTDANGKTIGKEGTVKGTPTPAPEVGSQFAAADATISNASAGAPVISGLHATFTAPGQSVTYSFKAINVGELDAFLRQVNFAQASATCTAKAGSTPEDQATPALVTAACADMSLSVKVGTSTYTATNSNITSHSLAVGASEDVVVTMTYADNGHRVDGDVDVTFGDVTLVYNSADGTGA